MITKDRLRFSGWLLIVDIVISIFISLLWSLPIEKSTMINFFTAIVYLLSFLIGVYVFVTFRDLLNFKAFFYAANKYILILILASGVTTGIDIFEIFYPSIYLNISMILKTAYILLFFSYLSVGAILVYSKNNSIPYLRVLSILITAVGIIGIPCIMNEIFSFYSSESMKMILLSLIFFSVTMAEEIVMILMFFKSSSNLKN